MELQFFLKYLQVYKLKKKQDKRQPTTEKTYSQKDNWKILLGESTNIIQNITLYNTK
jgi:hypothetical protein